jgi:predicted O-methyltransferase YrrM
MEFKRWKNLSEIVPEKVELLSNELFKREPVLLEIEEFAKREKVPILLPSSAQLLRLLVAFSKPGKVLEIGTGIGYSTLNIFFAYPQAQITTVELNPKRLKKAKEFFERAGAEIRAVEAEALDFVREELFKGESYDFIFVDSAKGEYPFFNYKLQALLNKGGTLLFDNVLFRGLVVEEEVPKKYKRGVELLKVFLKGVKEYPGFKSYLIPVGDGLLVQTRV